MAIRTLIVDDERLARERIRMLLEEEGDIEVVGECADGPGAVRSIEHLQPDLVFLDVQMPGADGFAVLAALDPVRIPLVIFVTAYDQYALRAFDVHAVDYLLKPFDRERFSVALRRARAHLGQFAGSELERRLLALVGSRQGSAGRLLVRSGGRIHFVRAEDIDWIEAAANYLRLHTGPDVHTIRETMTAVEEKLDPERFVRIHRSYVVNIDRIRDMEVGANGEHVVTLHDGTRLPLSRGARDRLQERLGRPL